MVLPPSPYTSPCVLAQQQWVKAHLAVADFLVNTGKSGLQMIQRLESAGEKLSGNSFRSLEGMYVPQDFNDLVSRMAAEPKVSVPKMKDTVLDILTARWWEWALTHPAIPESQVHPSRRMLPPCNPVCLVPMHCIV